MHHTLVEIMLSKMSQRMLINKTFPCISKFFNLNHVNKFCSNVKGSDNTPTTAEEEVTHKVLNEDQNESSSTEEISKLLEEATTFTEAKDTTWKSSPYPTGTVLPKEIEKPKIDPSETCILMFPGQGIIKAGMAQQYLKFPGAKEIFEIANEILGYDLLKLCLKGPQEKLDKTYFNQPATVVTSLAALEKIREETPQMFESCVAAAGYSVGELSALIFSGAISVEDGIRLVAARASAMQYASEQAPQGMLSVYCTPRAKLSQCLEEASKWALNSGIEDPVCSIAIYIYTQTKILGGHLEALKYVKQNSENLGLTKLRRLPVSGAFHTLLMKPALKSFSKALGEVQFDYPRCTVYANCNAKPYRAPSLISKNLMKQIVSPVKWEQIIHKVFSRRDGEHFPRCVDVASDGRMRFILQLTNAKAAESCIIV